MTGYRFQSERDCEEGLRRTPSTGISSGARRTRMGFDIASMISTDGAKASKSRRGFSIWPLLLVSLNLPTKFNDLAHVTITVGGGM